jgi:hypothetical protein
MHIQNTPRATQREYYWLTQEEANLTGWFPVWRIFLLLKQHHQSTRGF